MVIQVSGWDTNSASFLQAQAKAYICVAHLDNRLDALTDELGGVLLIAFLAAVILALLSFRGSSTSKASGTRTPGAARPRIQGDQGSGAVVIVAPASGTTQGKETPSYEETRAGQEVLGVERMVHDLERISKAWFKGFARDKVLRNLSKQGSVAKAYAEYFQNANEALKARRDLEQTRRELVEHLEIKALELQMQKVRLEAEMRDINSGKRLIGNREDYDL